MGIYIPNSFIKLRGETPAQKISRQAEHGEIDTSPDAARKIARRIEGSMPGMRWGRGNRK
jgi:hypothetical protein